MPVQLLVLDEWLFHHLKGEAGAEGQREAFRILRGIEQRCDRIAWKRDTPWARKAFEMMSDPNPAIRIISKFLHRRLLQDPKKSVVPGASSGPSKPDPLPSSTTAAWDEIPTDDRYLLEIYLETNADLFVTTDSKLIDVIKRVFPTIKVVHLKDFAKSYVGGSPSDGGP